MTYPIERPSAWRAPRTPLQSGLARAFRIVLALLTALCCVGTAGAADRLLDAFDDRATPAPWRAWQRLPSGGRPR